MQQVERFLLIIKFLMTNNTDRLDIRNVWICQPGNQKRLIEGQTKRWQNDWRIIERSFKHF